MASAVLGVEPCSAPTGCSRPPRCARGRFSAALRAG